MVTWKQDYAGGLELLADGTSIAAFAAATTIDATTISLDAAGASNFTVASNSLTLSTTTSGTLTITSAGTLDVNSVAWDVDASGTITIDGAGISIDSTSTANFSTTSADLTLSTLTSGTLTITSVAVLDINSAGCTLDATTLSINSTDTTNFTMSSNSADAKTMTVSAANAGAGAGTLSLEAKTIINTTVPHGLANGTVAAPSLTFTGDVNNGLYYIGADNFGVSINGVLNTEWLVGTTKNYFTDGAGAWLKEVTFGAPEMVGTGVTIGVWEGYSWYTLNTTGKYATWGWRVPEDWDGDSDIAVQVLVTVTNAETANDLIRASLRADYVADNTLGTRTQTRSIDHSIGNYTTAGMYHFMNFVLDYDLASNVIAVGDWMGLKFWLDDVTTAPVVTSASIVMAAIRYRSKYPGGPAFTAMPVEG